MSESVVKDALIKTIKELEESGDIVVVNPIESAVVNKFFEAIQEVSPNMLSPSELAGIINALNAHQLGFGLDARDFQTIIGITQKELQSAVKKLKVAKW